MKSLKLLLTVTCCVIIISSVGCSSAKTNSGQLEKQTVSVTQDFPHYSSVEDLTKKADLVIKGTILSSKIVEIEDAIQTNDKDEKSNPNLGGNTPSSKSLYTVYTIKITDSYKGEVKPGGTIEVKQLGGELDNKNYVMFLATYTNSPACLLNPIQSVYSDEIDVGYFRSINEKNDLRLSTKHLDDIKQKNTATSNN